MATLQDYLNFGKAAGLTTTKKPATNQTPAEQLNKITNNAYNPSLAAAQAAPKPSGGSSSNNSGKDPHINPATGVWDDNYYASQQQNSGASGGSSDGGIQSMYDEINKEQQAQWAQYKKGLSDYEAQNPFSYDEYLKGKATTDATNNIAPYYKQLLDNYMRGVENLKGNTIIDEQRALTKLQGDYDAYTGQAKNMLATTMRQVGQDYGNAGSYDAGARARAQGEQEANTDYQLGQEQRAYDYAKGSTELGAYRTLNQAIPLEVTKEGQAVNRDQQSAIYNQSNELATQAQQVHKYGQQQYATGQVTPQGQYTIYGGVLPGTDPGQTASFLKSYLPTATVNDYGGTPPTVANVG